MTNTTQHTPGPWEIRSGASFHTGIYSTAHKTPRITPRCVAEIPHNGANQFDTILPTVEDSANARLIAAAPELLKALQAYVESDDIGAQIGTEKYKKARAAIAKATQASPKQTA